MKEIKLCKLVLTTENKTNTIKKIEFLFHHKIEGIKEILISVYDTEDDQIRQVRLYEDHGLAKK